MKIGVIALQGAVPEHLSILKKTLQKLDIKGNIIPIRTRDSIDQIDALIIPGGESTTISKLLLEFDLFDKILEKASDNLPIMGTCAGCILLAKKTEKKIVGQELLKLMDMGVIRNAYGSQKESFEYDIKIDNFDTTYHAVFIRAPIISDVWGKCKPLAKIKDNIVLAKQGNFLACAFHPELTDDTRIHELFLDMI